LVLKRLEVVRIPFNQVAFSFEKRQGGFGFAALSRYTAEAWRKDVTIPRPPYEHRFVLVANNRIAFPMPEILATRCETPRSCFKVPSLPYAVKGKPTVLRTLDSIRQA
jgi:hypothetical protein